jgi:hypothetical protein
MNNCVEEKSNVELGDDPENAFRTKKLALHFLPKLFHEQYHMQLKIVLKL